MLIIRFVKVGWRFVKKNFDKAIYRSRGTQFIWLGCIVLVAVGIGIVLGRFSDIKEWRIVELILDPGCFGGSASEKTGSIWVKLFVTLLGSVVFTSLLINAFGNWLDRRIDNYRKGDVFYEFDDHILVLGANGMLLNILKSLANKPVNKNRDIVVLTTGDAESLRTEIYSELPKKQAENIYVVYGNRTCREVLKKLDVHETTDIYILGEDEESVHDNTNLECLDILKDMCKKSKRPINCYMVLEHLSTIQHYYYLQDCGSTEQVRLTIINALENTAQRVLVSRDYQDGILYPAIDGKGISANDDTNVHIVIVGMSPIGYAMATTAAHVCHFPNFQTKGKRTKITFVQKGIQQEMEFFMGRYPHLMKLSYMEYVDMDKPESSFVKYPDKKYLKYGSDEKGFLDIEWEFINGGIESAKVRNYIDDCAQKDGTKELLTIILCDNSPETNVAMSFCLPQSVYTNKVPVFVYQPGGGNIIHSSRNTNIYGNLFPFGMKCDCYDMQFVERQKLARRIQFLYHLADQGKGMESIPADENLLQQWFGSQYAFQQSNLYAANSILFKLRSISNDGTRNLEKSEIELLSETEHNRWNMERLLLGFQPYSYEERMAIKQELMLPKDRQDKAFADAIKKVKKQQFKHKDIAPYEELLQSSIEYDRAIVRNIIYVIR